MCKFLKTSVVSDLKSYKQYYFFFGSPSAVFVGIKLYYSVCILIYNYKNGSESLLFNNFFLLPFFVSI